MSGNRIYPNPAMDKISIVIKDHIPDDTLRFYNAMVMLLKEIANKDKRDIDISELSQDIYLIKSDKDSAVNLKFIK